MSPVKGPWPELISAGPAFDSKVGPFPLPPFVNAWFEEIGAGSPVTLIVDENVLPLIDVDGAIRVAGAPDVTDYHSPLGSDPSLLAAGLQELRGRYRSVVLDSLPVGSAAALAAGLEDLGIAHTVVVDEPTLVLEVVSSDYMAQLSKKQRHESRRKRRRLVEVLGEPELVIAGGDDAALDRFFAMHNHTEGDKGSFMTAEMERFFTRLYQQQGWEVAALQLGGKTIAAFFGYREPDCYYLYNSAYDPDYREVSPGAVALVELIQELAGQGCMRVDFLKGAEAYKFRMGAVERPLCRIECL